MSEASAKGGTRTTASANELSTEGRGKEIKIKNGVTDNRNEFKGCVCLKSSPNNVVVVFRSPISDYFS